MIRYSLKCAQEHAFDSWFASAEAFDKLRGAGLVACPVCSSEQVEKAIMAPRVRPARDRDQTASAAPQEVEAPKGPLQAPMSQAERAISEMRRHVEANSDYVGKSFAAEARKMHCGEIPHRLIYGEARGDEAKKLVEDGVPVAPLPFIPGRKTN